VATFDRQPVLESPTLLVRPMAEDDFGPLYAVASDPAVWEQHPSKDRAEEPVFREWFADALASGGALVVLDRGTVIGSSRFVVVDADEVEIGWTFLARSHWGGTWNCELKRLMLEHAFRSASTVRFTVHCDNARSLRAVEKLGAVRTGTEPDCHGRGTNVLLHLRRPTASPVS
jgi:N-acetyltransferase